MSLLNQYEQQYATLIAEITAHIGRLQQQSNNSESAPDFPASDD